jgi:hypothetical protein
MGISRCTGSSPPAACAALGGDLTDTKATRHGRVTADGMAVAMTCALVVKAGFATLSTVPAPGSARSRRTDLPGSGGEQGARVRRGQSGRSGIEFPFPTAIRRGLEARKGMLAA